MMTQELAPIRGNPIFLRPGSTRIHLDEEHRQAYRRLYGLVFPPAGVPALKNLDFDGRAITVTKRQLEALNRAFASLDHNGHARAHNAFEGQERLLTERFQEMQFLS